MSKIEVDAIEPQSGTTLTIGASGDAVNIASGSNFSSTGIDDNATSTAITIDSSENVGIGTNSPESALDVGTGTITQRQSSIRNTISSSATGFEFIANATSQNVTRNFVFKSSTSGGGVNERMRIDSSGRVGIGTSSPDSKLRVDDSVNQSILTGVNSNASFSTNGVFLQLSRNTTNNSFYAMSYYNAGASSYKFRVADSGNVTNTNNSYGSISDEKLKENIVDATPKLEKLKQVRIVNFNFIDDNQRQIGVIAQELENIFPSMVEESPDKDEDGKDLNTTTKQVKYSVFVPILIKALQEQQTKIEELEARITALENA
jgi:trimeric autotransporter adhesin